ncbi:NB-ARC domain-containing protein [Streptomyces sp. NPDC093111]|uniref:NB-ARC domain-containing protein n=1 Tax=Streptomyces sp. NPDC093111 TaxID=3154978 RepID=UPI0034355C4D
MRGAVKGASLAGIAAAVAVLASLAANAATSEARWPGALDRIRQQPWWWVAGLAAVGVLTAVALAWRQERGPGAAGDPPPPAAPSVPDWVVDRTERARTVTAVCRGRTVALTTSLEGAGGFGKTVLARAVAASPRVRRRFRGRVYTVTIGRDVRGRAAIAAKVAEVTRFVTGDTTAFDDPGLAGDHLGRLLSRRPRTLLLIDDVWDAEQLDPFLRGAPRCVRLVTTRVPGALPRGTERVRVDRMTPGQARAVLTWELPPLPEPLVRDLLEATGRWALLLRLTNRLIARRTSTGTDPVAAATEALHDLAAHGPAAVDGDTAPPDLDDPARRAHAVRATVEAARTLLPPGGARRLAELAVFAEDESIPVPLVARLWAATGGLTEAATRSLCAEFDRLSLVSLTPEHGGRLTLHDVLRDYLHQELGEPAATVLHGTLADTMGNTPWNPGDDVRGYVLDHAIEHLLAARRIQDAERLASDLRWIETRLHQRGPMAAWADLFDVPTDTAAAMADDLTRAAHLLTPTDPPELLTDVLHARLEWLPLWSGRIATRRLDPAFASRPVLLHRGTPPDLPEPALLRTFLGHTGPVWSVGVTSDGASLVTVGSDGMARGLDPDSGGEFALDVRGSRFRVLAVDPHDNRLVTGGPGRTFHVWNPDRATPPVRVLGPVGGRGASVRALAISGGRVASVATDGTLEIWDSFSGRHLGQVVPERGDAYTCVAFAPGGGWLAVGGRRHVWLVSSDLARTERRGATAGAPVNAIALAPDGSWMVTAEADGVLEIWNETPPRSAPSRISAHQGPATAVAVSPDGTWLVSGGEDGSVAVWDRWTGARRARYSAHRGPVHAVAVTPYGGRIVSAGEDGAVRVWDSRELGRPRSGEAGGMRTVTVAGDSGRLAVEHADGRTRLRDAAGGGWSDPLSSLDGEADGPVAFAPDGSWYAAIVRDGYGVRFGPTVREPGAPVTALDLGAGTSAHALAVAPDGTWLAIADSEGRLQLWDRAPERRTAALPGPGAAAGRAEAVAVAPDGSWVAVLRHRPSRRAAGGASLLHVVHLAADRTAATHQVEIGPGERFTALARTPDGSRLLTASTTGTVRHWDPRTGALLTSFTDPDGPVDGLSVSPDGRWTATAGALLRVRDATSGRTVAGVRAETPFTSCAWLPDGRGLVAVGERGLYAYEFRA